MHAPISVVIPTLNAEDVLPNLLSSLYEGVAAGLIREVIVSDGGSLDATCTIAEEAGARLVRGSASRGGQIARACLTARGDWLLILHADCILPQGWSNILRARLGRRQTAYFFKLGFRSRHFMARVTESWANFRSSVFKLPYGDQGLFISRAHLMGVGGYPEQPIMEDVALSFALKRQKQMLPITILTRADAYEKTGWLLRGAGNFRLLLRYLLGATPEDLKKSYYQSK